MYIHTYIHTHIYIYTYTHTHTHTHDHSEKMMPARSSVLKLLTLHSLAFYKTVERVEEENLQVKCVPTSFQASQILDVNA